MRTYHKLGIALTAYTALLAVNHLAPTAGGFGDVLGLVDRMWFWPSVVLTVGWWIVSAFIRSKEVPPANGNS